ncbi:MAG: hypothetical protein LLF95_09225 [Bacteroidales bacterium]|nr:hypothetical protein [Bacteroidales bacterium]
MDDTTKNSLGVTNSYPHNGKLMHDYIAKYGVNRAELARKMNVSTTSVYQYAGSPSLQLSILWKASLALNHNFLAELGEKLPVDYITNREAEQKQQIDELQKELEKLKFELSIYKNIVGK